MTTRKTWIAALGAALLPALALADDASYGHERFEGRDRTEFRAPAASAPQFRSDRGTGTTYGQSGYGGSTYGRTPSYDGSRGSYDRQDHRYGNEYGSSRYDHDRGNDYGYGHDRSPSSERRWTPDRYEEICIPAVTQRFFVPAVTERVWVPGRMERIWLPGGFSLGIWRDGCYENRYCEGRYEVREIRAAHWETRIVTPERCERRLVERGHW